MGGSSRRGGLGGLPTRSVVPRAGGRDHGQYLIFAPGTSEMALGLWPFLYLIVPSHTYWEWVQSVLVLWSFFVFCCSRRSLSRSRRRSKGSRVSAASRPLPNILPRVLRALATLPSSLYLSKSSVCFTCSIQGFWLYLVEGMGKSTSLSSSQKWKS